MELDKKKITSFFGNTNSSIENASGGEIDKKNVENNTIIKVPVDSLIPFKNHPFKLYSQDKKQQMIESIKEYGILNPLIVRPIGDSKYEIISGHNRAVCAKETGFNQIPVIVKQLSDDDAICLMVDTNFNQRENLLPSEKAFAYKMKFEALKRKGKELIFEDTEVIDNKLETISKEENVSIRSIQRYIKLTNLIPSFLELVDTQQLKFTIALQISFLKKEEQELLYNIMTENRLSLSESQADKLKQKSKQGYLDESTINEILIKSKSSKKRKSKITLSLKKFTGYIGEDKTNEEIEQTILEALKFYYENKGV